jgi:hypothetical protein
MRKIKESSLSLYTMLHFSEYAGGAENEGEIRTLKLRNRDKA